MCLVMWRLMALWLACHAAAAGSALILANLGQLAAGQLASSWLGWPMSGAGSEEKHQLRLKAWRRRRKSWQLAWHELAA